MTREERIARAKREILADVENGTVPRTVATFSDLHDYVDANGYGGFFDEGDILEDHAGDLDGDELVDEANAVHDEIDTWIKGGGLTAPMLEETIEYTDKLCPEHAPGLNSLAHAVTKQHLNPRHIRRESVLLSLVRVLQCAVDQDLRDWTNSILGVLPPE